VLKPFIVIMLVAWLVTGAIFISEASSYYSASKKYKKATKDIIDLSVKTKHTLAEYSDEVLACREMTAKCAQLLDSCSKLTEQYQDCIRAE